jgi:hypothetical protein
MFCGRIVDFSGGKVGLVRKVLKAGILQNSICKDEMGAICPTKVPFAK